MIKDYFSLAFQNLKHRGLRTWLTMLGIFIGIAAVVSLITLGQGLETAITGQFSSISTDVLTVSSAETGFGPPGATAVRKLNENDLEIIEQVSGIEIVIPRLIRIAKVEFNNVVGFRYIGSVPSEEDQIDAVVESTGLEIAEGRMLNENDLGVIVVGDDFVSDGSFDKEVRIGSDLEIQGKNFEVVGILERASTFTLNSVVLMAEDDMKDLLDIGDEIDLIAVKVSDKDELAEVAEEIERRIRKDRNQDEGEEDFSVQTPVQALSSVSTIIGAVNLVVSGIAALSLLIGGIGIANTMFTSVLERTREIGVMKAIGAKNKDILAIFIIEAGLLGLVGGLVGVLMGLGLAFGVAALTNTAFNNNLIQVDLSWPLTLGSIGFSFLIGILSGIIPALQASKLNPVEALRG